MRDDLDRAIACWKRQDPIPLDLHTRLLRAGYDVARLEAKHSRRNTQRIEDE